MQCGQRWLCSRGALHRVRCLIHGKKSSLFTSTSEARHPQSHPAGSLATPGWVKKTPWKHHYSLWSSRLMHSARVVISVCNQPSKSFSEDTSNNQDNNSDAPSETIAETDEPTVVVDHDLQELLSNIEIAKSGGKGTDVKKPRGQRSSLMDIDELVDFLRGENAQDICVINVPPERGYVKYFVTCTGLGTRHIGKMADNLVAELTGVRVGGVKVTVEGRECEDWMVVDLDMTVVHFMTVSAREKYELEKLWTLGPRYDDQYREIDKLQMDKQV